MISSLNCAMIITITLFAYIVIVSGKSHPLSKEYINEINTKQTTWKAGKNFDPNTSMNYIRNLLGSKKTVSKLKMKMEKYFPLKVNEDIPEAFDARENWPSCKSLTHLRDQASCGSCWAVAAAAAMTDRLCIHLNYTGSVSSRNLLSCCTQCGDGCNGGFSSAAWNYWSETGIVTGGDYETTDGCQAYSFEPCEHHTEGPRPNCSAIQPTPECLKECDAESKLSYENEITMGNEPYWLSNERNIQIEIMTNGPVEASFDVYEDFPSYKSGVYTRTSMEGLGSHAVKVIGWGVENDTKYWLISNSWNTDWGNNGYFKFLRGVNHCGIESDVFAGMPKQAPQ